MILLISKTPNYLSAYLLLNSLASIEGFFLHIFFLIFFSYLKKKNLLLPQAKPCNAETCSSAVSPPLQSSACPHNPKVPNSNVWTTSLIFFSISHKDIYTDVMFLLSTFLNLMHWTIYITVQLINFFHYTVNFTQSQHIQHSFIIFTSMNIPQIFHFLNINRINIFVQIIFLINILA